MGIAVSLGQLPGDILSNGYRDAHLVRSAQSVKQVLVYINIEAFGKFPVGIRIPRSKKTKSDRHASKINMM